MSVSFVTVVWAPLRSSGAIHPIVPGAAAAEVTQRVSSLSILEIPKSQRQRRSWLVISMLA